MPSGSDRRGEAGYNLVVLVMVITLMGVGLAAVLPLWSSIIRRDREEETIARGWQYAEAIRVFQRRFGRLPNRLEELIETEPRSIRRLWKDPLSDSGTWAVIVQLPQGGSIAIDPETGLPIDPLPPEGGGAPGGGGPLPGGGPRGGGIPPGGAPGGGTPQPVIGPIRGVKSLARGEAFQSLFGGESYESWEFTVDLLLKATSQPGPAGLPRWNALTIGRPYRFQPQALGATGLPGPRGPAPVPPGPQPTPGGGKG